MNAERPVRYECPSCPVSFTAPGHCDTLGCGRRLLAGSQEQSRKGGGFGESL